MSEEKATISKAFLEGLGIERGIIIGTTKDGNTRTYMMSPTVQDLAVYTKIIDGQIFKVMERGETNDNRNSGPDGVGEVGSSEDSREE